MKLSGFGRAQIAIVLTLAIPALVGAVAIGTDMAILYSDVTRVQGAADAAVVAGAAYLPRSPAVAIRMAKERATSDGIRSDEIVSTDISPDHLSITISIARSVPFLFANFLHLEDPKVEIVASARVHTAVPWHKAVRTRTARADRFKQTVS